MEAFKIFKGIHLLFFILICGQKPQSINATKICTDSRSQELFADLVCKNPITGESLEDSTRCKRMTSSMSCCCTHFSSCEKEDKIISIVDNLFDETFDSDTYDDPTEEFGTYEDAAGRSDSAGRSNEIPDPSGMCPFGMTRCCYNKNEVEMNQMDDCEPIKHQEAEDNFGLCNQGCSANLPSKMMTFKIAPKPAPKPTAVSKPKKPAFGAAFGRTEVIGVTKQCGSREFDDLNLPKSEVSPGEFPWTCTLWTETNGREVYLGSCAIIPNSKGNDITEPTSRVITAAHKLKSLTGTLKVRIEDANNSDDIVEDIFKVDSDYGASSYDDASGRDAAGRSSQISLKKDYLVTDIAEHPDFDANRLLNDISVLKLQKPIELATSDRVNAACIPGCKNMFDNSFNNGTGVRCWVAGWGHEDGDRKYQRKVDVPMYPDRTRCERKLNSKLTQLGYDKIDLHPGEVCAGGELNKDACKGDGGTPLVCQAVSGHWHVVGLVSWGLGCGDDDLPAVYVNVFHYLDFIYSSFADQTWVNIGDFARSQTIGK